MNEKSKRAKALMIVSSFVFEVMVIVGVFVALGYFLDQWLNTKVLFILVFSILGVFAGIYNLIRKINKVE